MVMMVLVISPPAMAESRGPEIGHIVARYASLEDAKKDLLQLEGKKRYKDPYRKIFQKMEFYDSRGQRIHIDWRGVDREREEGVRYWYYYDPSFIRSSHGYYYLDMESVQLRSRGYNDWEEIEGKNIRLKIDLTASEQKEAEGYKGKAVAEIRAGGNLPENAVSFTPSLPAGARISRYSREIGWAVEDARPGHYAGTVKVRFKDGSEGWYPLALRIKDKATEADQYQGEASATLTQGDKIANTTINFTPELPAGARVKAYADIDVNNPGTHDGSIQVEFTDHSRKWCPFTVTVQKKKSLADGYTGVANISVAQGEAVRLNENHFNPKLPAGSKIGAIKGISTERVGRQTGTVTVTFSDNSVKQVALTVEVSKKQVAIPEIISKPVQGFTPVAQSGNKFLLVKVTLPENQKLLPDGEIGLVAEDGEPLIKPDGDPYSVDLTEEALKDKEIDSESGKVSYTFKVPIGDATGDYFENGRKVRVVLAQGMEPLGISPTIALNYTSPSVANLDIQPEREGVVSPLTFDMLSEADLLDCWYQVGDQVYTNRSACEPRKGTLYIDNDLLDRKATLKIHVRDVLGNTSSLDYNLAETLPEQLPTLNVWVRQPSAGSRWIYISPGVDDQVDVKIYSNGEKIYDGAIEGAKMVTLQKPLLAGVHLHISLTKDGYEDAAVDLNVGKGSRRR